jgi:hypothetical protein
MEGKREAVRTKGELEAMRNIGAIIAPGPRTVSGQRPLFLGVQRPAAYGRERPRETGRAAQDNDSTTNECEAEGAAAPQLKGETA